jgi:hypothetical protein
MKHKFLFTTALIMILGLSMNTNAQMYYGLKIGVNSSAQSELGNLNDGSHFKPGFEFGLHAGYKLNNTLAVFTEMNHQNKGSKVNNHLDNNEVDVTRSCNYLTVPILLKAIIDELSVENNWKLYGYAGPYYGWLLKATDYANSVNISTETKIEDTASDTDWGLVFGMGVSYKLKQIECFTDIRYDMGLSEIISTDNKLRNKTIALVFGVNL